MSPYPRNIQKLLDVVGDCGVVRSVAVSVVDVSGVALCSQLMWLVRVDDGGFRCRRLYCDGAVGQGSNVTTGHQQLLGMPPSPRRV